MRFELSKSTPPHLNRGLQLRMLSFVGLIGIILFVLNSFQPKQPQPDRNTPSGRRSASLGGQDPRDQQNPNSLDQDEFLMPPDIKKSEAPPIGRQEDWQEPPPSSTFGDAGDGLDRKLAQLETRFDKRILAKVKDNTIGILHDEANAYYELLNHARNLKPAELEAAGLTDVQYINLMDQPNRFRGEPITIHGDLWRLRTFAASPNPQGIQNVYEAWIFTADSANHPYRVICTSVPADFEVGDNLRKPVQVTGYFFKREGYASNGGMHVAPTLLANSLSPYWPPGAPPPTGAIVPYMIGFVSAVGLAFLVTLVSFAISDRRAARIALERKLSGPTPSFAGINGESSATVEETLRLFAEQELEDVAREQLSADPAEQLHARDRAPAPAVHRVTTDPTEDELAEQLRLESRSVQNWTAQQHAADQEQQRSNRAVEEIRERHHTERVLESLQEDESETAAKDRSDPDIVRTSMEDLVAAPDRSVDSSKTSSRLATWEQEIQQLSSLDAHDDSHRADEQSEVRRQIERDLEKQDQELADTLQRQRAQIEHEQSQQAAQSPALTAEQAPGLQPLNSDHDRKQIPAVTIPTQDHVQFDRADRAEQRPTTSTRLDTNEDGEDSMDSGEDSDDESDSSNWSHDRGKRSQRRRHRHGGR